MSETVTSSYPPSSRNSPQPAGTSTSPSSTETTRLEVPDRTSRVEDLLASPCVGRTVILLHDTLNASVRAGLEQVDYDGFDKVRFVDLDFVQGRVLREGPHRDQLWSGLGLVVTGADFEGPSRASAYPAPDVYEAFSSSLVAGGHIAQRLGYEQLVQLERHAEDQRRLVKLMERSWSWRVTAPLRRARTLMRRRRSER